MTPQGNGWKKTGIHGLGDVVGETKTVRGKQVGVHGFGKNPGTQKKGQQRKSGIHGFGKSAGLQKNGKKNPGVLSSGKVFGQATAGKALARITGRQQTSQGRPIKNSPGSDGRKVDRDAIVAALDAAYGQNSKPKANDGSGADGQIGNPDSVNTAKD